MFTGIIKETGKILKITSLGQDAEIEVSSIKLKKDNAAGDSIAVNGICLTVREITVPGFIFDISYNTLKYTSLKNARQGDLVNLEGPLLPDQKIGGHFVSGHVDGTSRILEITEVGRSQKFRIEINSGLKPFVTSRGSIAIDGISLTVTDTGTDYFEVVTIPHTLEATNLAYRKAGDIVNIEVDMLARYVISYLNSVKISENNEITAQKDQNLKEMLEKHGFI